MNYFVLQLLIFAYPKLVVYLLQEIGYIKRFSDKIICSIFSNSSRGTGMSRKHNYGNVPGFVIRF